MSPRETIGRILLEAVEALPDGALGIRTHAIDTDQGLTDLVAAAGDLVRRARRPVRVVIGTDVDAPTGAPAGVWVEAPHDAATTATSIRNDVEFVGERGVVVYVNVSSTAGEAGLDGLRRLSGAELALHYAELRPDLPVLKKIAGSRARALHERLREATLGALAEYADLSSRTSEQHALPVLSLLPGSLHDDKPSARWAHHFDGLVGHQVASRLRAAASKLERLPRADADRTAEWLRTEHLDPGGGVRAARVLARAAAAFADAETHDPAALSGLSRRLLRWLERGPVLPAEDPPTTTSTTTVSVSQSAKTGERPASVEGRARLQWIDEGSLVRKLVGGKDYTLVMEDDRLKVLLDGVERFIVRPSHQWRRLEPAVSDPEVASILRHGGELHVRSSAEVPELRLADVIEASLLPEADEETGELLDELAEARRALLEDAAQLAPEAADEQSEDEDEREEAEEGWMRGLRNLCAYPLLCARYCNETHQAYVQAHEELVSHVSRSDEARIGEALLRLDLAVAVDRDHRPTAVRVLPAHPLRVLRHLLWLEAKVEPPALPELLALSHRDVLHPTSGDLYLALAETRPGPRDVIAAATLAAEHVWALVAPRALQGALRVRVSGMVEPEPAVDALVERLLKLFEQDAQVGAVHVELIVERELLLAELHDRTREALETEVGSGVSLRHHVLTEPYAGWVHAEVRGAPWGFSRVQRGGQRLPPGLRVDYQPGKRGHIERVGLVDDRALDAWAALQKAMVDVHPHAVLEPPRSPSLAAERCLVSVVVSPGGWPCSPDKLEASALLGYSLLDHGSAVSVVHRQVDGALEQLLPAALPLPAARRAALSTPCLRSIVVRHLEGAHPTALLGQLGHARALHEVLRTGTVPRLALSLDTRDARAWLGAGEESDADGRADMIVLELTPRGDDVSAIRVVEVKARSKEPTEAELIRLSTQARVTAARVRRILEAGHDGETEAFRRLVWLGAGFQRLAWEYQGALRQLDRRLTEGDAVAVDVELWVVLPGRRHRVRAAVRAPSLDAEGLDAGGQVDVKINILGHEDEEASSPPSSGGPPAPVPDDPSGSAPGGSPDPGAAPGPEPEPLGVVTASKVEESPLAGAAPVEPPPLASDSGSGAGATEPGGAVEPPPPGHDSDGGRSGGAGEPSVDAPAVETQGGRAGVCFPVGRLARGMPVSFHPSNSRLNHLNVGIVGDMGTGKTQLTKYLIARMVHGQADNRGHRPRFLIFDYKRDYSKDDFVRAVDATVVEPEGIPLNILRLGAGTGASRRDRVKRAHFLVDTLKRVFPGVGHVQQKRLKDSLLDAYSQHAEPMLQHVLHGYQELADKPDSVQSILEQLVDLEVFTSDPAEVVSFDEFLSGAVTVRLDQLAGLQGVQNIIVAFMLNMFYEWMLTVEKRPIIGDDPPLRHVEAMLLVDEADNIMQYEFPVLQQVLQQGREFGVGVLLASQYLSHFYKRTKYDYREPLLSWFIHRVPNATPRDLQGVGLDDPGAVVERVKELKLHDHLCVTLGCNGDLSHGLPFWRYRLDCWRDQHPGAYEALEEAARSDAELRERLDAAMAADPPDLSRPPRGYRS